MTDDNLHRAIEQFLYREARLLDGGEFEAWLDLFTEDARYFIPSRENRRNAAEGVREAPGDLPLVDDDKKFLAARVARIRSGFAHAEEPLSRTRHFVSNVEILGGDPDGGYEVHSNLLVFQSRLEKTENFYVGHRVDRLVRPGAEFRIRHRRITLDQVLLPRSLSILL